MIAALELWAVEPDAPLPVWQQEAEEQGGVREAQADARVHEHGGARAAERERGGAAVKFDVGAEVASRRRDRADAAHATEMRTRELTTASWWRPVHGPPHAHRKLFASWATGVDAEIKPCRPGHPRAHRHAVAQGIRVDATLCGRVCQCATARVELHRESSFVILGDCAISGVAFHFVAYNALLSDTNVRRLLLAMVPTRRS